VDQRNGKTDPLENKFKLPFNMIEPFNTLKTYGRERKPHIKTYLNESKLGAIYRNHGKEEATTQNRRPNKPVSGRKEAVSRSTR